MVKHKNIVRFLGYYAETHWTMVTQEGKFVMADVNQRLLCFEYLPNGSLDKYITGRIMWPAKVLLTCIIIIEDLLFSVHHVAYYLYI